MWEQRYGFPAPRRAPSGYRRYDPEDVETLRRAQAYRRRGLSVRAATLEDDFLDATGTEFRE